MIQWQNEFCYSAASRARFRCREADEYWCARLHELPLVFYRSPRSHFWHEQGIGKVLGRVDGA